MIGGRFSICQGVIDSLRRGGVSGNTVLGMGGVELAKGDHGARARDGAGYKVGRPLENSRYSSVGGLGEMAAPGERRILVVSLTAGCGDGKGAGEGRLVGVKKDGGGAVLGLDRSMTVIHSYIDHEYR